MWRREAISFLLERCRPRPWQASHTLRGPVNPAGRRPSVGVPWPLPGPPASGLGSCLRWRPSVGFPVSSIAMLRTLPRLLRGLHDLLNGSASTVTRGQGLCLVDSLPRGVPEGLGRPSPRAGGPVGESLRRPPLLGPWRVSCCPPAVSRASGSVTESGCKGAPGVQPAVSFSLAHSVYRKRICFPGAFYGGAGA